MAEAKYGVTALVLALLVGVVVGWLSSGILGKAVEPIFGIESGYKFQKVKIEQTDVIGQDADMQKTVWCPEYRMGRDWCVDYIRGQCRFGIENDVIYCDGQFCEATCAQIVRATNNANDKITIESPQVQNN